MGGSSPLLVLGMYTPATRPVQGALSKALLRPSDGTCDQAQLTLSLCFRNLSSFRSHMGCSGGFEEVLNQ